MRICWEPESASQFLEPTSFSKAKYPFRLDGRTGENEKCGDLNVESLDVDSSTCRRACVCVCVWGWGVVWPCVWY